MKPMDEDDEKDGVAVTLLRLAVKTLCDMALHMRMRLPQLMLEVAAAYDALREDAEEEARPEAPTEPAAEEQVQIIGAYYGFDVPQDIADKLVRAALIAPCGDTHYHPNIPEQAHPSVHERMRVRIVHFLAGLRN